MKKFIKKYMGQLIGLAITILVVVVILQVIHRTQLNNINPHMWHLYTPRVKGFADEVRKDYPLCDVFISYTEEDMSVYFHTLLVNIPEDDAKDLFYRADELLSQDYFWDEFYAERDKALSEYEDTGDFKVPNITVYIQGTDYSDAEILTDYSDEKNKNDDLIIYPIWLYKFTKDSPYVDEWTVKTAPEDVTIPMP